MDHSSSSNIQPNDSNMITYAFTNQNNNNNAGASQLQNNAVTSATPAPQGQAIGHPRSPGAIPKRTIAKNIPLLRTELHIQNSPSQPSFSLPVPPKASTHKEDLRNNFVGSNQNNNNNAGASQLQNNAVTSATPAPQGQAIGHPRSTGAIPKRTIAKNIPLLRTELHIQNSPSQPSFSLPFPPEASTHKDDLRNNFVDSNQFDKMDYEKILSELFPTKQKINILQVIETVKKYHDNELPENQLEGMINMLVDEFPHIVDDQENLEGADCHNIPSGIYFQLLDIFPDICQDYLLNLCKICNDDFDTIFDQLTSSGYEKIVVDYRPIWKHLQEMLPEADPNYLKEEAKKLTGKSDQDLESFIQKMIESNNYPTMAEYLRKQKIKEELALYRSKFNVTTYLENIPSPLEHFSDPNRVNPLAVENVSDEDINYALIFLYNRYRFIKKRYIKKLFDYFNKDLIKVYTKLEGFPKSFRQPRPVEKYPDIQNKLLLQEIAYLKHKKQLHLRIKMKGKNYHKARKDALKHGLLETCKCCFDDDLIPEECYFCMKGCVFCKSCVKKGAEVVIGKGETTFQCYTNCGSSFSLRTLQMVLEKKVFEGLSERIQTVELQQANIEGLESCPACGSLSILEDTDKIIKCKNVDCLVESCRKCRHESHIPQRCSEIEYDEDVQRRTFIENEMAEALIRKCHKCKKPFIKSSPACNKITCICGAKTCYLCGKEVVDYSHFNTTRCPLFTNDASINLQRVQTGARKAKEQLGNVDIKFDPAQNIENFF